MFTDEEAALLHLYYLHATRMYNKKDLADLAKAIKVQIHLGPHLRLVSKPPERREALVALLPKVTPESLEWYQQNYPEYTI